MDRRYLVFTAGSSPKRFCLSLTLNSLSFTCLLSPSAEATSLKTFSSTRCCLPVLHPTPPLLQVRGLCSVCPALLAAGPSLLSADLHRCFTPRKLKYSRPEIFSNSFLFLLCLPQDLAQRKLRASLMDE